jgi:hypothetical protein
MLNLERTPPVRVNTINTLLKLLLIKRLGGVNHEMLKQPETQ